MRDAQITINPKYILSKHKTNAQKRIEHWNKNCKPIEPGDFPWQIVNTFKTR